MPRWGGFMCSFSSVLKGKFKGSANNNNNTILIIQFTDLLFMCQVNSYKANYRQHSVNIGKYIIDRHNIKSKVNYRNTSNKQTDEDVR
jgi:hypothetical protein